MTTTLEPDPEFQQACKDLRKMAADAEQEGPRMDEELKTKLLFFIDSSPTKPVPLSKLCQQAGWSRSAEVKYCLETMEDQGLLIRHFGECGDAYQRADC